MSSRRQGTGHSSSQYPYSRQQKSKTPSEIWEETARKHYKTVIRPEIYNYLDYCSYDDVQVSFFMVQSTATPTVVVTASPESEKAAIAIESLEIMSRNPRWDVGWVVHHRSGDEVHLTHRTRHTPIINTVSGSAPTERDSPKDPVQSIVRNYLSSKTGSSSSTSSGAQSFAPLMAYGICGGYGDPGDGSTSYQPQKSYGSTSAVQTYAQVAKSGHRRRGEQSSRKSGRS